MKSNYTEELLGIERQLKRIANVLEKLPICEDGNGAYLRIKDIAK